MSVVLRYGASNSLKLDFADQQVINSASINIESIDEILQDIVHTTLNHSIHFPAFREIVFPEDTLSIAVGEGIPQIAEILACIIDYIQTFTEVALEDITIVFPNAAAASSRDQLKELLDEFVFSTLTFEVHNPDTPEEMAYLTATEEGEPIRLNKRLVDSDVVLPICLNLPESILGYAGFFHDLFPLYTESETMVRFHSDDNTDILKRDSLEAANMLGVQYLIKVTPANGEEIHNITAGDIFTLQKSMPAIAKTIWSHSLSDSDLSIGTLEGSHQQQTWDQIARALNTLSECTMPGGSIVICSELSGSLPEPVKLLAGNNAQKQLAEQIKQHPDTNSQAAQQILQLRNEYRIYFLSNLSGDDVESIGLANIESPSQINNLITAAKKINCLGDAHRIAVN
ncbi:MAG: hypothetical protein CMJ76_15875 [Planctomycetaceae bacterium]|nr:hypothetical protein [Planctomycetaceae bacterium]